MHSAKDKLENSCNFASTGASGFNTQNWSNVTVIPVTCTKLLTQITGIEIPSSITTMGNKTIQNLSTLSDNDFNNSSITGITTTQMQDCKTPSSGYCNNVPVSVTNYEASISASLTAPLVSGPPISNTLILVHNNVVGIMAYPVQGALIAMLIRRNASCVAAVRNGVFVMVMY